ncbi:MAG TPA: FHA domain-containing protein [Gemmataceae bacterium]|jgi:hypothetical protein|nr:FHA domain-containing protein [Gemmataceae bacterium]
MTFRLFIYYCALYGGCAAFVGWMLGQMAAGPDMDNQVAKAAIKGLLLGMLLALGLALVDGLWSFSLGQIVPVALRTVVAVVVGTLGGLIGGIIGEVLYGWLSFFLVVGWVITGLLIGASLGAFDVLSAAIRQENLRGARRKLVNGILGGAVGGVVGGVLLVLLRGLWAGVFRDKSSDLLWSPSATGFIALGMCIGLSIGLAQVILKEAWVRVEAGFRAGRELILSKEQTTIGRGEACDIGLFGDPGVERFHARIVQGGDGYLLADAGTPGGTYLNGTRIYQPAPLHSGDTIQVGNSVLSFKERQQRTGS